MLDIAVSKNGSDPASEGLAEGNPVGLLGIEMHTRRRNRLNGVISSIDSGFRVTAGQSFGNCPRYIQLRDFTFSRDPGQPVACAMEELRDVDDPARSMIGRADNALRQPKAACSKLLAVRRAFGRCLPHQRQTGRTGVAVPPRQRCSR